MDRRTYLALSGAGLGTIGGYVGWNRLRYPTVPDGMTVDTLSLSRNVLESDERRVLAAREKRHTVIETEAAARTEIRAIESATDFVAATTFEEAFLIVVQNGMRSEAALELQSVGRTDDGLDLQITVDNPLLPDHDDLTTHSLLVRVTDEKWRVPGDIAVAIEGYR